VTLANPKIYIKWVKVSNKIWQWFHCV